MKKKMKNKQFNLGKLFILLIFKKVEKWTLAGFYFRAKKKSLHMLLNIHYSTMSIYLLIYYSII